MSTRARVRGYTLVELIVSIGLFSIVMLVATTAYLAMIELDRQSRSINDVVTNLNFAVDTISRSIRTGTAYSCSPGNANGNCWSSGGSTFSFTDDQGRSITYLLITNPDGSHTIGRCVNISCSAQVASALTDPRIDVSTFTFYLQGVGNDSIQPEVIIVINGSMQIDPKAPPVAFTMETAASQRLLDLY